MILLKTANYLTNPATFSAEALFLMKNHGNNRGTILELTNKAKKTKTPDTRNVTTFSVLKISASKVVAVLFTFQHVQFPHACTPLYFHFSLHPSALISLKSEPFISSFSCFVVQCSGFSPFLIPCRYSLCVCVCECVRGSGCVWVRACVPHSDSSVLVHTAPDRSCHQLSARAGQSGISVASPSEPTESNHARVNITHIFSYFLADKPLQNSPAVFSGPGGWLRPFNRNWLIY